MMESSHQSENSGDLDSNSDLKDLKYDLFESMKCEDDLYIEGDASENTLTDKIDIINDNDDIREECLKDMKCKNEVYIEGDTGTSGNILTDKIDILNDSSYIKEECLKDIKCEDEVYFKESVSGSTVLNKRQFDMLNENDKSLVNKTGVKRKNDNSSNDNGKKTIQQLKEKRQTQSSETESQGNSVSSKMEDSDIRLPSGIGTISELERRALLDLIRGEKVLGKTVHLKMEAWHRVADELNKLKLGPKRTGEQLHIIWDWLKSKYTVVESIGTTMSKDDRIYWSEFIELYKELPCLWNVKHNHYSDKAKKTAAYKVLVNKLKKVDGFATRETVTRKINNLRSSFRKEHKKVMYSMENTPDDVYQPSLWYYEHLLFLLDQEPPTPKHTNNMKDQDTSRDILTNAKHDDTDVEASEETESIHGDSNHGMAEHICNTMSSGTELLPCTREPSTITEVPVAQGCKSDASSPNIQPLPAEYTAQQTQTNVTPVRQVRRYKNSNQVLSLMKNKLSVREEDQCDAFGNSVAASLRDLPREMKFYAQKLISDVIFHAQMGKINDTTQIYTAQSTNLSEELECHPELMYLNQQPHSSF